MKKLIMTCVGAVALTASASWYWPFGSDAETPQQNAEEQETPRLHTLLVPANDHIEAAEDAASEGDVKKAVAEYVKALEEMERVRAANPDRAETPEFAPLRNREAACRAAIDSLRFMEVNRYVRPVALTDTAELQKKYDAEQAEKKKGKAKEDTADAAKPAEVKPAEVKPTERQQAEVKPEVQPPEKPPRKASPKPTITKDMPPKLAQQLKKAYAEVAAKDYAAADLLLEDLEKRYPNNLSVLLLRAAAQSGTRSYYAARRTLERAMRVKPKDPRAYYNLAYVVLALGESKASAREYYELGRSVGGKRDRRLEKRLEGK